MTASIGPRAAHFLLGAGLAMSPPNEAIVNCLLELGYDVDLFAPDREPIVGDYGPRVGAGLAQYDRRWLAANLLSRQWSKYRLFSGTSENPLAVVAALALRHRRPCFALVDEIKSGSYYGDAPEYWKKACRWAMRRAGFCIVNDASRVSLLRDYAGLDSSSKVIVYPSSLREPPAAADRRALRTSWGIPGDAFVIGVSGGFNETSGAQWLIEGLKHMPDVHAVIQPVGINAFTSLLLRNLCCADRISVQEEPLGWRKAWASAAASDIGLAVYTNPAPQFQHMGISSNRLCMYLAMGVPVIASRQRSFQFLEDYGCGVLVESQAEFNQAVEHIRSNLAAMKTNALRCSREYVDAPSKQHDLLRAIEALMP